MGNFRNQNGNGKNGGYRAAFGGGVRNNFADDKRAKRRPAFLERREQNQKIDERMSVLPLKPGSDPRVGWLYNMVASTVEEPSTKKPVQAIDLFFIPEDGGLDFCATIIARPYMLVATPAHAGRDVEAALRRDFRDQIAEISSLRLEDTSQPNHLAVDENRFFLKVETRTSYELRDVKEALSRVISRNADRRKRGAAIDPALAGAGFGDSAGGGLMSGGAPVFEGLDYIEDIREFDVAPVNRFAIDSKVNVGYWYRVSPGGAEGDIENVPDPATEGPVKQRADPDVSEHAANSFSSATLVKLADIVDRADPVVLAYDIECTKAPLKFPDAHAGDQVMMISWMIDGKGYLGINREVVAADIDDFEYAPHNSYKGSFEVFNEANEIALLRRFFQEVRLAAPRVFVTFNGDYFDWPFVETRAAQLGLSMLDEIGMQTNADSNCTPQTQGRTAVHMDVFHWVNRDSYLPQGSRGLKAVTRALLGFEPEEIPPEEMMAAASERPEEMARYSVSDAVCTYYLYMKYVHPFTFSLCNIIPLAPDDVLRKGSGTLCEMLLMCQAKEKCIVAPNKNDSSAIGKLTKDGRVLETETYIGGHVEALRTGIYRSDLPCSFKIDVDALADLEASLDETLKFAITVEGGLSMDDIENYDEVRQAIVDSLHALRDRPVRDEKPLIYHLDVSAMYPNIILTNRLQPHAIVTDSQCASCDFMGTSNCQRSMEWAWRGEVFPASRGEAEMVQRRAAQDEHDAALRKLHEEKSDDIEDGGGAGRGSHANRGRFFGTNGGRGRGGRYGGSGRGDGKPPVAAGTGPVPKFSDVEARKNGIFRKRLKEYCRINYRRGLDTRVETREATVCQRENPFYVDTVRAFRDRRYEYKALLKKQKRSLSEAKEAGDAAKLAEAERKVVLYDSLQLAHKCILNSFYGYVMRKGARWYSMEMAGIVTNTGGLIIKRAKEFIDRVGLPLELDTDGIWCVLPVSFPENYTFNVRGSKPYTISYICSVFNSDVAANFSNHQYQTLKDPETLEYETRSECSIVFEVDGPYRAMVLPASLEEGKSIKKRYAVFNDDGSLAELKGFEIKRRGELKLIKEFQGEIFKQFLEGGTLKECYETVGAVCNKWLHILTSQGEGKSDAELLDLLVEQNNMSKPLEEYVKLGQKSLAITCASRMRAFLGDAITANAGLATYYVVSSKPDDSQVTERAIPVQVFDIGNENLRNKLLRKWTKTGQGSDLNLRNLIDWNYYKGRYANAVLKIVSIPAALQAQDNPVPGIEYPAWLLKRCRELQDKRKQKTVVSFFAALPKGQKPSIHGLKPLQDSANDTARLPMTDIEDMPLKEWTEAKRAARRNVAIVARKKKEAVVAARKQMEQRGDPSYGVFRSRAVDPLTREREARNALLALMKAPRPDKQFDYAGWLHCAKKIWRAQRAVRVQRYSKKRSYAEVICSEDESEDEYQEHDQPPRQRRCTGAEKLDYEPANFVADAIQGQKKRGGGAFFDSKVIPLLGRGIVWQVISISPVAASLGSFKMWVMPICRDGKDYQAGDMYCVPLRVNRVLYVGSRNGEPPAIGGGNVEKANGMLPRSQQHDGLYRVEIPEPRFRAKDKELSGALTDPLSVDAVYGTKAPLVYEAILDVGILCAPRRAIGNGVGTGAKSVSRMLTKGVQLDDLATKNVDAYPYLTKSPDADAEPLLHQAFLYGSHASDNTSRALYTLFTPAAKQVLVIIVTSAPRPTRLNMASMWAKVSAARDSPSVAGCLAADVKYNVRTAKTRSEAWDILNIALGQLRDGNLSSGNRSAGRKMLVLAQWPATSGTDAHVGESVFDTTTGDESQYASKLLPESFHIETCLPALARYPVVRLACNGSDGSYQPVGWEPTAAAMALSRFADNCTWLLDRLALSRSAGIPVGNMSTTDDQSLALDVLVGRELRNQDHVLWASEGSRPDLGGLEDEDNVACEESIRAPEVSNPGSYRTICIDTELSDLAVASILSSSHVNQLEGTDLAFDAAANPAARSTSGDDRGKRETRVGAREGEIGGGRSGPLDEMAGSAPAFRVLKSLVTRWERTSHGEGGAADVAKDLLDHLYRWIGSESSLLYDASLARFLAWLTQKMFWQLLNELRGLGAGIVYASCSRLILETPKIRAADALRYAAFLERTVKSKPLFQHIRFEPLLAVNASMLFVDRFNFGAVPAPEEDSILSGDMIATSGGSQGMTSLSRRTYGVRDIPAARMAWDVVRYLPIPVAILLSKVLEEFIRRPMIDRLRVEEEFALQQQAEREAEEEREALEEEQRQQDELALMEMEMGDACPLPSAEGNATERIQAAKKNRKDTGTSIANRDRKPSKPRQSFKPRGDGFAEEVKSYVRTITGYLMEQVQEIRKKTPLFEFPDVPTGLEVSENGTRNPALEFVRTLCHLLSLDKASVEEVSDLRRNLLRLLGVREFAREARFVDPSLPVVLRNVICRFCNTVVDLDLARDARLWDPESHEDASSDLAPLPWSCEYCSNSYDKMEIELALIRDAQKLVVSYQVQDLQCKKCKLVKRDNMSLHCPCSGAPYELVVDSTVFYRSIRALRSVAKFHSFELLAETVDWIYDSCGHR